MQHGSKDQRDLALFALEAVALDTETTGLDPRKARLIEIGGVVLAPGGGETDQIFETFVNAGDVPAEAARVTGIDTGMLAGAPGFPDALRALQDFVAGRVAIGHSFGFDLAVLAQECRSHGLPQWSPLALDTRFLAQVAFPNLPAYTLETIAARCGIELGARHRALGDAISCARIFGALAPHLREKGVRTLGEALAATRRFEDDQAYPSMWEPLSGGLQSMQGAAARAQNLDPFLFSRRVSDVMTRLPKFIAREASVADAAQIMARDKVGSLFVGSSNALSRDLGILTERDVLGVIAREGAAGLAKPVGDYASRPLQSVAAPAFVYRAVGRMTRLGVRHLGVMDEAGRIIGAISARDLLKSRMSEPVALGDAIDMAPDVVQLGKAWGTIPAVARALLANELDGRQIAAVVAREVAALTRRAALMAQERLAGEGAGDPPCAYTIMILGSAGRGESLLAFDQDNALVFAHGDESGPEDIYFARLGEHMCEILHAVGVPLCPGGVMAKNASWRGSLEAWRARTQTWLHRSRPEDLLAVDIAYDWRPCAGDLMMGESLWRDMQRAARNEIAFLKLLAQQGEQQASPFGFFGRLQTENSRIDLKLYGLKAIVTGARALALRHGVEARATALRLQGVRALGLGHAPDLDALDRAHKLFLTLILRQQLQDIAAGKRPSNKVDVSALDAAVLEDLREGLKAVAAIPDIVRDILMG